MDTLPVVEIGSFALFMLLAGCIAAGVTAAVVHTWSLRALAYSLSVRLDVVEGTLSREVKARAGQERWKKPDREKAELELLLKPPSPPARKMNWWERPELARSVAQK